MHSHSDVVGGAMHSRQQGRVMPPPDVHVAWACRKDSHSLRFYETGVSSPGSGLPVYSVVAYVDDQEILSYSDDTRQLLPKAKWMEKFEREYWERETKRIRNNEPAYKRDVQKLMNRFNHTGGIHILQWMYGCELRDDGSTAGYMQDGYDGRDFNYLDTQRWIYVPMMDEAQILTQRWNSPEVKGWEVNKIYLENICTEYLKKFIEYGKEDLEKRVRPEVKVWAHQSDMVTTLHCLVYGFHPRAVEVTWVRNGTDHVISDEAGPILPHPDGTYQTRVIVEVPTAELDSYSCQVDHSSLGEILIVSWDQQHESQTSRGYAKMAAPIIEDKDSSTNRNFQENGGDGTGTMQPPTPMDQLTLHKMM
ncbi:class I histocompatibility antigen, F10 alpha chain-like [Gastrophryne carolinensis]